jgi:hypothetical protein
MSGTRSVLVALAISAALTLILYGSAVALPFYSDDLLQVPWVEETKLPEFWTSVGPYRDYRPLHYTLWRLIYLATGDLQPQLLHALNLVGHVLCATLVAVLATRLWDDSGLTAVLAAALFTVFPFAFDAIPWAIGFSYPLTVALALSAILVYLRARANGSTSLHLFAVGLTALTGFAYEGGVVAGPLILLVELVLGSSERRLRFVWPLIHFAVSSITFASAALVRPQGTSFPGLALQELGPNLVLALQSFAFPLGPLASSLVRLGVTPHVAVVIVGLPTLAALVWLVRRGSGWGHVLLALGWWIAWCLPPLATLRNAWLQDAPRVFYAGAAGPVLLLAKAFGHGTNRARIAVSVTLALLCILPAAWFVTGRMDLYTQVGDLLWDVVVTASDTSPLLVVNLPSRITPPTQFYPIGHEGIIPLPSQVGADDLLIAHIGQPGAAVERSWGPIIPPLPYSVHPLGAFVAMQDLEAAARVATVIYRADRISLQVAGAVLPAGSSESSGSPLAEFGQDLELLTASCSWSGSDLVVLSTSWRILAPIEGSPTVFAHLLETDGTLVSQSDGDPLQGLYPFSEWRPGQVVQDVRVFHVVSPSVATVELGVWDPGTGQRWVAYGSDGELLTDNVYVCSLSSP